MPAALSAFISGFSSSPLGRWSDHEPWQITTRASAIVNDLIAGLREPDFRVSGTVAVHRSATIEAGAVIKGPVVIGPGCFVASGAYLRAGVWLGRGCAVGPGTELKSSFLFEGSKLAHFNFVGDSVLGSGVNLEAGSAVANRRNERPEKEIRIREGGVLLGTGVEKFGALIGDHVRIGANAVVAPGSLLLPGQVVPRLALVDQEVAPPIA
jgi:NDP-sugar pyrophosphorylase family protein